MVTTLKILFIALTSLVTALCSAHNDYNENNRNVLILNSSFSQRDDLIKGIKSVFDEIDDMEIKITREYPDSYSKNSDYELYLKKLTEKYSDISFDLVITADLTSFDFATKKDNTFLKNVPVVFCGINQFGKNLYEDKNNVTGTVENIDIKETLKTALNLHPQAWRVYVINDSSISDISYMPALKESLRHYQDKVDFVLINNVSRTNIINKIKKLPKGSIILILSCLKHDSGEIMSHSESIRIVSANTPVPVYGIHGGFMGYGLIGGKITDSFTQGKQAAEQAASVLRGKNINTIPVSAGGDNKFMFDYNELKKYSIKKPNLPKNSVIINMPPSLFNLDSKFFISALMFVFLQMSVIIFLLSNLIRTKKFSSKLKGNMGFLEDEIGIQTKELRKIRTQLTESTIKYAKLKNLLTLNEEKHRILFEASGEAIIIIHSNKIEDCNLKALELYQYEKDQLTGMDIEKFFGFFGPYKQLFTKIVSKTNSFTIKRVNKNIYECYSAKKDGDMFYAELVFSPMEIASEIYIQLIIRDITNRKKIEETFITSRRLLESANKRSSIDAIIDDFNAEILKMQKEATVGICIIDKKNKMICEGNKLCRTLKLKKISPKVCSGLCVKYINDIKISEYFTSEGSFFTNNIKKDCEKFPEELKKHMALLNEKFGYISMAVIPIKNGKLINGFIRVMDTKQINPDKISMFENVAMQLQIAYQRSSEINDTRNMILELEQARKQETIGSLTTGLIHEINAPLQFIGDNIEFLAGAVDDLLYLVSQYRNIIDKLQKNNKTIPEKTKLLNDEVDVGFLQNELPSAINQSKEGMNQVSRIIKAMREFSMSKSDELTVADINKAISNVIIISNNEWKYISDIKTDFSQELPLIPCYIGEISHMILILLLNSISSVKESIKISGKQKGLIKISTFNENNHIVIQISDNGIKLPNHLKDKMFDPLLAVKEHNKNLVQGLPLAYEIVVKKHNGKITVKPNIDEGTLFTVKLPLEQPAKTIKKNGTYKL